MKFIKVTDVCTQNPVLIRADMIVRIEETTQETSNGTCNIRKITLDNGEVEYVFETLNQLLNMIRAFD